jgi:hypothetical protein
MEGVVFLIAIIAVGMISVWCHKNDSVSIDGETGGFFAMRRAAPQAKKRKERG